jgi:hypothetical protein
MFLIKTGIFGKSGIFSGKSGICLKKTGTGSLFYHNFTRVYSPYLTYWCNNSTATVDAAAAAAAHQI